MLKRIKDFIQGKSTLKSKRSPKWGTVRAEFIKKQHSECYACGSKKDLEVHHIVPFHVDPKLELDPTNLVTLCESMIFNPRNCHLFIGHNGNYKKTNPHVIEDALKLRASLDAGNKT